MSERLTIKAWQAQQPYPDEEDMAHVNQCLADGKPEEACEYLRFWGEHHYNALADKIEKQAIRKAREELHAIRMRNRAEKAHHHLQRKALKIEQLENAREIIVDDDESTIDALINSLNNLKKERY